VSRIVIIGNAGGGKSTLARKLAKRRRLHHVEIDCLLWQEGWKLTPTDIYERQHAKIIAGNSWVIDGLGQQATIADRIARATDIIPIDMPLWMHFWLAAERQIAWGRGTLRGYAGRHHADAAHPGLVSSHLGSGANLDAGGTYTMRQGRKPGKNSHSLGER
jgi:hypothetical protein